MNDFRAFDLRHAPLLGQIPPLHHHFEQQRHLLARIHHLDLLRHVKCSLVFDIGGVLPVPVSLWQVVEVEKQLLTRYFSPVVRPHDVMSL
jgi:hypothetical protein